MFIFQPLQVLSSAMNLLRKCRVNAALTIQLFSQLFHFINMWTFNQVNYFFHDFSIDILIKKKNFADR